MEKMVKLVLLVRVLLKQRFNMQLVLTNSTFLMKIAGLKQRQNYNQKHISELRQHGFIQIVIRKSDTKKHTFLKMALEEMTANLVKTVLVY
jgi:hypothetical protein